MTLSRYYIYAVDSENVIWYFSAENIEEEKFWSKEVDKVVLYRISASAKGLATKMERNLRNGKRLPWKNQHGHYGDYGTPSRIETIHIGIARMEISPAVERTKELIS